MRNQMRPIHPGEILREEFLAPLDMSANKLAHVLGVPTNRITEILAEKRSVSADTALRLARAFSTTPEFWLNLQVQYELRVAEEESGPSVRAVKPLSLRTGTVK
jgi:addiction module HigA family antidote